MKTKTYLVGHSQQQQHIVRMTIRMESYLSLGVVGIADILKNRSEMCITKSDEKGSKQRNFE